MKLSSEQEQIVKEVFPSLNDFNLHHVPTKKMVSFEPSRYPYRIECNLCGKPIVLSDNPIPKELQEFAKNTACSECEP